MLNDPANIVNLNDDIRQMREAGQRHSFDGGGGGGYDPQMEKRVEKLETDFAAVKIDLAVIRANYATKEDVRALATDLHKEINAQTWKLVTFVCGFGTALVGATYFLATHVK